MTKLQNANPHTTQLNKTEITVSRIAFGCMSTVKNPTYDGIEHRDAIAAIHAAMDAGITLFDTAPGYGDGASEILLGEAMRGRRDRAIIATKAGGDTISADEIERDCEVSLERLQTDYIDLYQIHWPRRVVPLEESMRALDRLREKGKVRAIGVSNFGPNDMAESLKAVDYATNQVAYSLLMRAPEKGIGDLCLAHDVGLLCYSPIAQGLLTGRFRSADDVPDLRARTRHFADSRPLARHGQPGCEKETFAAIAKIQQISDEIGEPMAVVALAWLLHQPIVTSVLAGASNTKQVLSNVRALDVTLTPEHLAQLDEATADVKQCLGDNMDCWAAPSRIL